MERQVLEPPSDVIRSEAERLRREREQKHGRIPEGHLAIERLVGEEWQRVLGPLPIWEARQEMDAIENGRDFKPGHWRVVEA